mmetsp:Transcript_18619/g.59135  ORF Transcript_18619/g.59135 Transcript_18619/m.59135 type:complete len:239 (-) Transcript_18619:156-872(-)
MGRNARSLEACWNIGRFKPRHGINSGVNDDDRALRRRIDACNPRHRGSDTLPQGHAGRDQPHAHLVRRHAEGRRDDDRDEAIAPHGHLRMPAAGLLRDRGGHGVVEGPEQPAVGREPGKVQVQDSNGQRDALRPVLPAERPHRRRWRGAGGPAPRNYEPSFDLRVPRLQLLLQVGDRVAEVVNLGLDHAAVGEGGPRVRRNGSGRQGRRARSGRGDSQLGLAVQHPLLQLPHPLELLP